MAISETLGFKAKAKEGTLTADEQKQIFAAYKEKYSISFADDKKLDEDAEPEEVILSAEEQQQIAEILNVEINSDGAPKTQQQAVNSLKDKAKEQQQQINKLKQTPEEEAPETVTAKKHASKSAIAIVLGAAPHSAKFLFGIEDKMFARGKWYNDIVITRKPMADSISKADKEDFITAFTEFTENVQKRVKALAANNSLGMLVFDQLVSGESHIDYTDLVGTAGEYIVRRTDLILAHLRSLPSVSSIFPVVSNVQNKEIAPNADFGELSQGYRSGRIFKGNVKFAAEVYSVVDVMFKYKFDDLIKLEKQYIGYLNREGSNVIKWTFIEWVMVHFGTILQNEQQRRRVSGVAVPQQNVVSNPANLAADGAIRAIERVVEQFKVLPYFDLGVYNQNSIVDVAEAFWDKVTMDLDSTEGYKMFMNAKHRQWFVRNYRSKYSTDNDFTGAKASVIDIAPENIVWVPNMPVNCYLMWITIPGNVENYEDKPGEMTAFYFERDFEDILTLSRWKEGSGLLKAGVQYKTQAELEAAGRGKQWIFVNYPASDLVLAASISFKDNLLFEATGNTQVDTVTGYSIDFVYKIVAGDEGVTLNKAGAFSEISETFTSAKGGYIKVYAQLVDADVVIDGKTVKVTQPSGKFLELERKVVE